MKVIKLLLTILAITMAQQAFSEDISIHGVEPSTKAKKYSTDYVKTVAVLKDKVSGDFRVAKAHLKILSGTNELTDDAELTDLGPTALRNLTFKLTGVAGLGAKSSKRYKTPVTSTALLSKAKVSTRPATKAEASTISKKRGIEDKTIADFYNFKIQQYRKKAEQQTLSEEELEELSLLEKELNITPSQQGDEETLNFLLAEYYQKIENGQKLTPEEQSIFDEIQKQLKQLQLKKRALGRL